MVSFKKTNRKAISPIIATVLIIAVTLIASVAIAGFVFGIFSSGSSTAQVAVVSVVIKGGAACSATTCSIVLSNSGTANTYVLPTGTITFAGSSVALTIESSGATPAACTTGANPSCVVPAGGTYTVDIVSNTAMGASGTQFVGSLSTGNGAVVTFAGVFS